MNSLEKALFQLQARVAELERANATTVREGRIIEAFPGSNEYVVDASGVKTNKLPFSRQAGDVSEHISGVVGQHVLVVAPGGDMSRAVLLPGGYTDDFSQPDDEAAAWVRKIGNCVIKCNGSTITLMVGGVGLVVSSSGVAFSGGSITHDGTLIDKDHTHTGVIPGGARTGKP